RVGIAVGIRLVGHGSSTRSALFSHRPLFLSVSSVSSVLNLSSGGGMATGFFTDTTLCIGCKACEVACKQWNQLPADNYTLTGMSYDNTVHLGATAWRHGAFVEQFDGVSGHYMGLGDGAVAGDGARAVAGTVRESQANGPNGHMRTVEPATGGFLGE